MNMALDDLLPHLSTAQVASLLVEAARRQDEAILALVVKEMTGRSDLPMTPVHEALAALAGSGRWDLCAKTVPLVQEGHRSKMQADLWEQAAKQGDAQVLDYLDALHLRTGNINLNQLLDSSCGELIRYALDERPSVLPTWEHSNRALGAALARMAEDGEGTCQRFIQHLEAKRLPEDLKRSKHRGMVVAAWSDIITHNKAKAAAVLAGMGMWPASIDFEHMFHRDIGKTVCEDPTTLEHLSGLMMGMPIETMSEMDLSTLDRMIEAGLPVFSWRGPEEETIAHLLLHKQHGRDLRDRMSWLLLRNAMILMQPDEAGRLPLDGAAQDNQQTTGDLGQRLRSLYQAQVLERTTGTPASTPGRGVRF